MMMLAIDLYCGLGGWAEGLLAEGWRVIGFDIERHDYGTGGYPGQLVIQDVLTLHGSQFKDARLIVASPPCQAYSYRAMPWKRAKALPPPDNSLFDACFRIQRKAIEAAGRYIPLIVENVRGASKWVGRAKANFGSYYLWGDVGMVGRRVVAGVPRFGLTVAPIKAHKVPGFRFDGESHGSFQTAAVQKFNPDGTARPPGSWFAIADSKNRGARSEAQKIVGYSDPERNGGRGVHLTSQREQIEGRKQEGSGVAWFDNGLCKESSKSDSHKAASAMIAKIPFPLAQHIARCFKPDYAERLLAVKA